MNPKERLVEDLKSTVSKYLALYESDTERMKAALFLIGLIAKHSPPEVFGGEVNVRKVMGIGGLL